MTDWADPKQVADAVARHPLPDHIEDKVMNLEQAAAFFGVAVNTMRMWVGKGLPVDRKATGGRVNGGYQIRLSKAFAWHSEYEHARALTSGRAPSPARSAALRFMNLGVDEEEARGLTPKEIREYAEAAYKRDQAAVLRGELVRADRVSETFDAAMLRIRKVLGTLPDWLEREFGLEADEIERAEQYVLYALDQMRDDLTKLTQPEGEVIDLGDAAESASGG